MRVLITDPISDNGLKILEDAGLDLVKIQDRNHKKLESTLPHVDAWIVRSGTKVTSQLLGKASQLKAIGRAGVGVDNIDIKAATLNGVVVMNTPEVNTISAAEHTIALILALARNIHKGYTTLSKGQWERHKLVGTELQGKTLGVVGLGRIGTEVIKRLRYFGMDIIGHDPYISEDSYELDYVQFLGLNDLCRKSDIITIHVPLNESTRGLFDLERLKLMKQSAIIVNCARGGIIIEEDLKAALDKGIISGAAIDVFENEPPTDSPLLKTKNILFTPHLGASTREAKEGVSTAICQQIRDFLLKGKLENALNVPVPDLTLLEKLKPYLLLAEKLGLMHQQLSPGPVHHIFIETQGSLHDVKLVTLSFLKGLLEAIHGSNVNFVNAAALAESRGIHIHEAYNHDEGNYSNIIIARVTSGEKELEIHGSLFSEKHPRLVYFDGFHLDFNPSGNLLIIYNKDVPGVVGKVGTFLAEHNINIASYQLSRKDNSDNAISIIQVDTSLTDDELNDLTSIKEILFVKQVTL